MKFAVPFLKMFAVCMLWRAQFLSDFDSVFCVHQVLGTEGVPKSQNIFLLLALIQDGKPTNI